jgi:hypothetical protein
MKVSAALDETIASLDRLNESRRARVEADRAVLAGMVARLDDVIPPDVEDFAAEPRRQRPAEPQPAAPDGSWPFDGPPIQDGRPGHEFTGALRQKLIAQALEKGDW